MARAIKPSAQRALQFALESPWAITEGALQTILEIAAREHDVEAGMEAIAAKLGQPLKSTETASVRDGIATIPVAGPLFRYANLFTAISGATSYETLATDLTAALDDPAVGAILLTIDSPGGTVNGMSEMGELIYGARGRKPIIAMASDQATSAAYLIASAADAIVASPMAVLGSLGVKMAFQDTRKRDEARGIQTIEIISSQSPRKGMDPNNETGRADLQAVADSLANVLIETVARNRSVTPSDVLARFGQGGVFVGQEAVAAGLADRVATYEAIHAELAAEYSKRAGQSLSLSFPRFTARPPATVAAAPLMEAHMSTKTEKTDAPSASAPGATAAAPPEQLTAAQVAERYPEAAAALRTEGATAERTRILAIEDMTITGHEALVAEAKRDPAMTPEAVAVKLVKAQKEKPATTTAAAPDAGARHLGKLAGDEATANAPTAQPAGDGSALQQTVQSIVALSSLRRPAAGTSTAGDRRLS